MTFAKIQPKKYPRRLWALAGEAGSGKSTFATQLRGPLLLIDADHRFDEVVHLTNGDVLSISEQPIDHIISDRIAAQLRTNMPGARVGTIVVDSLTAIIKPLMVRAVRDNDAGVNKNKVAGFKDKATAMSQIQDAVTAWGTDVLWIWHLQQARNEKAVEVTRATISDLERTRLQRSLNVELHLVLNEKGRRGLRVAWVRKQDARSGFTLYDESGRWLNMPEQIEAAIYDPKVTPATKPAAKPAAPVTTTSPAPATPPAAAQPSATAPTVTPPATAPAATATATTSATYPDRPERILEEPQRETSRREESQPEEPCRVEMKQPPSAGGVASRSELDEFFGPNPRAEVAPRAEVVPGKTESVPAPKATEPAPAPQSANGNGKPTRPLQPETLKDFITRKAATHTTPATPAQRSLAAMQLEACFAGDMDSDIKRHAVQRYLIGVDSLRDAADGQILALLDWLKPIKDSGGQYLPDLMAANEAQGVIAALGEIA